MKQNIRGLPTLQTVDVKDIQAGDFFATGLYCYLRLPSKEATIVKALNLVSLEIWSYDTSKDTFKCLPIEGSIEIRSHPWASHIIKQDTSQ